MRPSDPLFTRLHPRKDIDPHQPLNDEAFARELQYWCKKAGIEKHVTIHSFRHTGARARYEAGSGIREIQKLLRHSSLQTTDIYLRTLTGTADPGYRLLEAKYGHL